MAQSKGQLRREEQAVLKEVERLVSGNQWGAVRETLSAVKPGSLGPALTLVQGVACKESQTGSTSATDAAAIAAMAAMLGVSPQSPLALVMARRTLRTRSWKETQAPSNSVSGLILVLAIAIGLGLGWLITEIWL